MLQEMWTPGDLTWPDRERTLLGQVSESQIKGIHFLLLTSQRVINCFIISLFENHQILISKSILIELGLNLWSQSEHDKPCLLNFKRWKWPFCFRMESILLGHIYHMISNDSITCHTVKKQAQVTWFKRTNSKHHNFTCIK